LTLAVVLAISWLMIGVIAFVVSTVVFVFAFAIYAIAFPPTTAGDRLQKLTAANESGVADLVSEREARAYEAMAARLGRMAQGDDEDAAELMRKKLVYAGYKSRRALEVFNGVRVGMAMLLPVMIAPSALWYEASVTLFAMFLGVVVGYYGPIAVLTGQAQGRQAELLRSYPDALDLMVSSVESGLSLDQAFRRVAIEMKTVSPSLSKEFSLVNSQVSAGITRIQALRRLEERTGLEEVRSFVNTLTQAERFGSSVAASMRMYASVAREKRMARAEEKAGQVGSKLTIIMIFFFLPVLMFVLLVPSILRIYYGEDMPE
jgi:tight adherence protein C